MNTVDYLYQIDFIEFINNKIGTELWTTIYSSINSDEPSKNEFLYCALIPNESIEESLNREQWDFHVGDGLPSYYKDSDGNIEYEHFYTYADSIQPLVIIRDFYGIKPNSIEILEEFRLFHNLYFDNKDNKYIKISDDGSEEEIIIIEEELVKVKTKAIRLFLTVKEMHLAIFFDSIRREKVVSDESIKSLNESYKNELSTYSLFVGKDRSFYPDKYISRLCGKKLISPLSKEKINNEDNKDYESFIIGIDEDGDDVSFCCNPDNLANYFGANPNSPHYLTPIFFKREVLSRYYSCPEKFTVEDGLIGCGGLWSLQIDNNHEKYVTAFLGDLGKLSHKEQLHWKIHNIQPDGKISSVNYKRSFLAEFTNSEKADLAFKSCFSSFQYEWYKKFGWYLFKPLAKDDQHYYTSLRIPLTNEQAEFDSQVLALTKLIIDSLNEDEIEKQIIAEIANLDKKPQGITKLEYFLKKENVSEYYAVIEFFRNIQNLRSSGVGHRKGKNYIKISKVFEINVRNLMDVFEDILKESKTSIDLLRTSFL
jgi:ASC-1-like (ASCH) protein